MTDQELIEFADHKVEEYLRKWFSESELILTTMREMGLSTPMADRLEDLYNQFLDSRIDWQSLHEAQAEWWKDQARGEEEGKRRLRRE